MYHSPCMNCIFCDIVAKKADASIIYEDEHIMAFMDIQPVREGQALVIPKTHIDHFSDLDNETATRIIIQTQKISRKIMKELSPERVGLVVHGYGVAHAHIVIIPQYAADDITSGRLASIKDGEIIFTTENIPFASREELDKLANILK